MVVLELLMCGSLRLERCLRTTAVSYLALLLLSYPHHRSFFVLALACTVAAVWHMKSLMQPKSSFSHSRAW